MHSGDDIIGSILLLVTLLAVLPATIYKLKKNHAREIYLIWYINSFFFLLLFGLGVVSKKRNIRLTEVCGSQEETCKAIYGYLTNIDDEISIIVIAATLAIGPSC